MPRKKNGRNGFAGSRQLRERKQLTMEALIEAIRKHFAEVPDPRPRCNGVTVSDALLPALAMFSLKDVSLLQFEPRRMDPQEAENLKKVYGMQRIPSDTQMREILDRVDPDRAVRPLFLEFFRRLQRGKVMQQMVFWKGHYLNFVYSSWSRWTAYIGRLLLA